MHLIKWRHRSDIKPFNHNNRIMVSDEQTASFTHAAPWHDILFCLLLGPPGFNCWFSCVPDVFFDTPGISRCRSQHVVSVEFSSLFHHSIYLWFICFPWWSIDELENLHADRTTECFVPWEKPWARLGSRKTGLSPPPPQYFNTDRSKAVLLLGFLTVTCSCCPYLYFGWAIMLVIYFSKF